MIVQHGKVYRRKAIICYALGLFGLMFKVLNLKKVFANEFKIHVRSHFK